MNPPTQPTQPQLRPYQQDIIDQINTSDSNRLLVQLPTGGGKTVIFSELVHQHKDRALIVAHRTELILQAVSKLTSIGVQEGDIGIIKNGYDNSKPNKPIQVCSVQSWRSRGKHYEPFPLTIIDEAHRAAKTSKTYQGLIEQQSGRRRSRVIGFTATPIRLDGAGFRDTFDTLITGASVRQLINDGHLSDYKCYLASFLMNTKGVRSIGGDYNIKQLAASNGCVELSGQLLSTYEKHASGKQTLVFAVNVAHSRAIAERYSSAGIPAISLDGTTPAAERAEALGRFARKEIQVLCNYGLFTEGFDCPGIDAVQIARPTKSLSLYLQMVGRALRPTAGKPHAIIIDHTANTYIHKTPAHGRTWSLDGVTSKEETVVVSAPGGNGELIERTAVEIHDEMVLYSEQLGDPDEVERLTSEYRQRYLVTDEELVGMVRDIIANTREKEYKMGAAFFRVRDLVTERGYILPRHLLRLFAVVMGYQQGWVYHFSKAPK